MYKELNLFGSLLDKDIKKLVFEGLKYNINGICCAPSDLIKIKEFIPPNVELVSLIDYPYGLSCISAKHNSILESAKHGATSIDFVINQNMILNKETAKIKEDVQGAEKICADRNLNLRLCLDSILLEEKEILSIIRSVYNMGFHKYVLSTNLFSTEYTDLLILATNLQKKLEKIQIIFSGSIWNQAQYQKVVQSKVFGIRLQSPYNLSYLNVGV